uniref:Uncharacterized protein n=1 Tax=Plectus sambesii TaxID=2011161 RepID=A0A914UNL2_9BILA
MMRVYFLLLSFTASFCIAAIPLQQAIKEKIFEKYDRTNRPVQNESTVTKVRLNPALFSFVDIDVAAQTLKFKQWNVMQWRDEFLTWDPDDYDGLAAISVPRASIWLPDITIMQQVELTQLPDAETVVIITNEGDIRSSLDQVVTTNCQFNVIDFPYDTQFCEVGYSSWFYGADKILPFPNEQTDLTAYNEDSEWTMKSYTTRVSEQDADNTTYVNVYYQIKITRKPSYYETTFMWPAFLITALSILGVFTPFNDAGEREEKVTMGLTTLLTMAVILMIITDQMPKSSTGMPLLAVFIMIEICLASFATIVAVGIIYLHSQWMNDIAVPKFLFYITFSKCCMPIVKKTKDRGSRTTLVRSLQNSQKKSGANTPKFPLYTNRIGTIYTGEDGLPAPDYTSTNHLEEQEYLFQREMLREQWSKVTHRLDLILLIFFWTVNGAVMWGTMAIGNSKLDA